MFGYCLASFMVVAAVSAWPDPPCRTPPLAANYTIDKYSGRWFEIGKIQTPGGGFFERGCECTHIDVSSDAASPLSAKVSNICNKDSPTGKLIVFNQTLSTTVDPPNGRYNASSFPGVPTAAYNVIVLQTGDYSVEYDCTHQLGITNYCVHILSRKSTLPTSIINQIIEYVRELKLNTAHLEFVQTKQDNCTYSA